MQSHGNAYNFKNPQNFEFNKSFPIFRSNLQTLYYFRAKKQFLGKSTYKLNKNHEINVPLVLRTTHLKEEWTLFLVQMYICTKNCFDLYQKRKLLIVMQFLILRLPNILTIMFLLHFSFILLQKKSVACIMYRKFFSENHLFFLFQIKC